MPAFLLEFQNSSLLDNFEKTNGKKKEITEESRQEGDSETGHRIQLPKV